MWSSNLWLQWGGANIITVRSDLYYMAWSALCKIKFEEDLTYV